MARDIDPVVLRPGQSITFKDRDHLLQTLDRLDQPVPERHAGRSRDHGEYFCMVRYLRRLAGEDLIPLPVTLRKSAKNQDPSDFLLEWTDGRQETFELTDGSTQEWQKRLAAESRSNAPALLVLPDDIDTSEREVAQRWAEILFSAFLKKAEGLRDDRFDLDHLLIYDLTALGLLLPLQRGAPLLRQKIEEWYAREAPANRFGRISILRDQALLLDLAGEGRLLRRESPHFELPLLRADDEEDLRRRLREIDRYCREHSIRHLKAFGSILGDRIDDFREGSDLDLLVEFEPGKRVTLLDMARMERELGELTGFKVDLRTAGDLSRYFRQEVQQAAVELRATRG